MGDLALQGLDLAGITQVQVLGANPKGAVAGYHLFAAQVIEGGELLADRAVAGAQGGDLAAQGADLLL